MYALIRTIHLYSGLVLAVGMFMYAFTGLVMTNQSWFSGGKDETTTHELRSEVALRMAPGMSKEQAGAWRQELAEELELWGRPGNHHVNDEGEWVFEYGRPGTNEKLTVRPGKPEVTVTLKTAGFAGTMNRLHHFHGYSGGGRFFFWGLFVDLASLAMILFPLTGILLWYRLKKDRRLGWAILGGSSAYVVGSMLYLVLGR